jgi:hypothetical protein
LKNWQAYKHTRRYKHAKKNNNYNNNENNLKKIVEYCELDVWVLANVFLKLNSMDTIGKAQTKFI